MCAERGEAKCTTTLKAIKGGRSKWMSNTFFSVLFMKNTLKDKDKNCVVCYNVILLFYLGKTVLTYNDIKMCNLYT